MLAPPLYGSVVGLSLGLTGGGGSIFAVPLLVYGLGLDFRRAVLVSLAVVGLTALYGALLQARRGMVLWGAGGLLGLGGIIVSPLGALMGRWLPERLSLLLFAALMVVIALKMLRKGRTASDIPISRLSCQLLADGRPRFSFRCGLKLVAAGTLTGMLSGIFGVGGGFLVVPAILVVTRVGIERAMATSLVAIFLISTAGFSANSGDLRTGDLDTALWFLAGSAVGMTLGSHIKSYVSARCLEILFAVSVLGTAVYVLARNL